MPFQSSTTKPDDTPIRFFFHGLIILRSSDDDKSCIGEIHRAHKHPHKLSIEVRMKVPGDADLILLRHFGKLSPDHSGLTVVVNGARDSIIYKYVPDSSLDPFVTKPTDGNKEDFGWALNLESQRFHKQKLQVDTPKTRPGVTIKGGHCYLHTAFLKRDAIDVEQGGVPMSRQLQGLASVIGASLDFAGGSEVVITCDKLDPLTLKVPPAGSNIRYEIYVDNSPLFEPPGAETHDEMEEYYRAIVKDGGAPIPKGEKFKLIFPATEADTLTGSAKVFTDLRASIRIPCMPITLDG